MATDKEIQEKAAEMRKEYLRKWRKNNPDKIKAAQQRYWQRKAQQMLETDK